MLHKFVICNVKTILLILDIFLYHSLYNFLLSSFCRLSPPSPSSSFFFFYFFCLLVRWSLSSILMDFFFFSDVCFFLFYLRCYLNFCLSNFQFLNQFHHVFKFQVHFFYLLTLSYCTICLSSFSLSEDSNYCLVLMLCFCFVPYIAFYNITCIAFFGVCHFRGSPHMAHESWFAFKGDVQKTDGSFFMQQGFSNRVAYH